MKKIISIFLLVLMSACEFHPIHEPQRVHVYPVVTVEPLVTVNDCGYDPYPYPIEWAQHCDSACCVWDTYESGWYCAETWCYDDYYCEWNMSVVCY